MFGPLAIRRLRKMKLYCFKRFVLKVLGLTEKQKVITKARTKALKSWTIGWGKRS